jgi:hypothetical protein
VALVRRKRLGERFQAVSAAAPRPGCAVKGDTRHLVLRGAADGRELAPPAASVPLVLRKSHFLSVLLRSGEKTTP